MKIETVNEKVKACKFVGHENIVEVVEGDIIVPDIKPDILSLIHVDGNVFVTRKEVQEGKVKLDGGVEVFALYAADDEKTSMKGLNALLNFSESIEVADAKEGMLASVSFRLIGMEHKVINSRKISVKCSIEMNLKILGEEEIEVTKDVSEAGNLQYQKKNITLSELVGASNQKVEVKENILLGEENPSISEILKTKLSILHCDYKISYNKILVKADLKMNVVYVADNENMTLATFDTLVPIAGFLDLPGVNEKNTIDIDITLCSAYVKPIYQDLKANGVNLEAQVEICAKAYEEKTLEVLDDLYNPVYEMKIENKNMVLKQTQPAQVEELDLSQVLTIPELDHASLLDLNVIPNVNERKQNGLKTTMEGTVNVEILYYDGEKKKLNLKKIELPFQKSFDVSGEDFTIMVANLEYELHENGQLDLHLRLKITCENVNQLELNLIASIEQTDTKNVPVASLVIYYVQPGDSLWKIAKKFRTTVELIQTTNALKEDTLQPGQQLMIPKVVDKVNVNLLT